MNNRGERLFDALFLLAILCIPLGWFGIFTLSDMANNCYNEHTYTGIVKYKYNTSAGYKVPEKKHVVFYCDSLRRNIDVKVTNNESCNISVGDTVSFDLSYCDLNN